MATAPITGVARTGDREVLGPAVGDSEDGRLLDRLPAVPLARGLTGVKLVISDAAGSGVGIRQSAAGVSLEKASLSSSTEGRIGLAWRR